MSRFVKPLALVLALPVLVAALGLAGRARWESRWDPWMARQMASQRALPYGGLLARPTLSTVCADGRVGLRFPPCATYDLFSTAIGGSSVVGEAGLAFLAALLLGGWWCRGSRRRLVWLLRPSLVATALGTSCLAVAHGLLAAAAVVVGAGALWFVPLGEMPSSLLLALFAAGTAWGLAMGTAAFGLIRQPTVSLVGQVLDLSEQSRLVELVKAVSAAVGAEPPDHVVACLVPWLFVTEGSVTGLDRRVSGRTLCLSLPLARILSVEELRGQLAHDLAHFSREQVAFTTRVMSPLVGVARARQDARARSHGFGVVVREAPLALLSLFMGGVGGGQVFYQDRERAADAAAAAVVGREAFAAGLVKVAAFTPAWHAVFALMQSAAFSDTQYVNVSEVFQEIAASNAGDERLIGVGRMAQGHPVDRHAPLGNRLEALGVPLREVAGAALATAPQPSSATLVAGCEAIERRLSTAEHQLILETGGRIGPS